MPTFHFTNEQPSQQIFRDFQILNSFSDNQLEQLVDLILSYLTNDSGVSDLMELLSTFGNANAISLNSLKSISNGILNFFKGAIRANLSLTLVKEDLLNLGLTEENAIRISSKYKSKFIEMSRAMIGQTLNVNQLVDLEWSFGVTASSSELGKIGSTYLQLKLVLDKGNNTTEDVHMDLTLSQFYEFLHEMQKAKANLDFFSM